MRQYWRFCVYEAIFRNQLYIQISGFRSPPLARGACLATYPRPTAARAGLVVPGGQRGVRGAGQIHTEAHAKQGID